jgi:hypothetical protein
MAYHPFDHKVVCDQCGFVKLRSQCRKQWDGLLVCGDCYDIKHPSYELKVKPEKQPEDLRPEGTDVYLVDPTEW